MASPYIERILKARVYDVAVESPLEEAPRLSRRLGNHVLLKREDLQPVFSFKLRGAYNRIAHLSDAAAKRGVVCASAGNHAQGVALSAKRRGIPAVVVMPRTTPQIKVQAVIDLGGEVELHGDDYDTALERALARLRTQQRVALLHYSPVRGTVEGEPLEILPYLGTSRLEDPLNRHPVDVVFHGHAHHGALEGHTSSGTPVYNVAMPLLLQKYPDRPPFRVVELPAVPPSETEAALMNARQTAGAKKPPIVERPRGTPEQH